MKMSTLSVVVVYTVIKTPQLHSINVCIKCVIYLILKGKWEEKWESTVKSTPYSSRSWFPVGSLATHTLLELELPGHTTPWPPWVPVPQAHTYLHTGTHKTKVEKRIFQKGSEIEHCLPFKHPKYVTSKENMSEHKNSSKESIRTQDGQIMAGT